MAKTVVREKTIATLRKEKEKAEIQKLYNEMLSWKNDALLERQRFLLTKIQALNDIVFMSLGNVNSVYDDEEISEIKASIMSTLRQLDSVGTNRQ